VQSQLHPAEQIDRQRTTRKDTGHAKAIGFDPAEQINEALKPELNMYVACDPFHSG
jgi:hypothetical protein